MEIKRVLLAASICLTGLYSCTQPNKNTAKSSNKRADKVETPIKGCYLYTAKKDTLQLAITKVSGKDVEGSIIYNFYEKDDAKGTFTGSFDGEILKGDYTFVAEGSTSVREVIFKKTQTGFIEGAGEVKVSDNKAVFADINSISYQNGIAFTKTENCLP